MGMKVQYYYVYVKMMDYVNVRIGSGAAKWQKHCLDEKKTRQSLDLFHVESSLTMNEPGKSWIDCLLVGTEVELSFSSFGKATANGIFL